MRNVLSLIQKELRSYFCSPIAYVVLTLFFIVAGLVFSLLLLQFVGRTMTGPVNAPYEIIRNYLAFIRFIFLSLIPLITMGVFAEERKKGTIELLLTSPLTDIQLVAGKFGASLTFALTVIAGSVIVMAPLFFISKPALAPTLISLLGIVLFAAAIVSLGNFISILTENQIVAAVLTYVVVLVLWLFKFLTWLGDIFLQQGALPTWVKNLLDVLVYLSPLSQMEDFLNGVIDLSHVVFFLSVCVLGLFMTYRSLESLRWRG